MKEPKLRFKADDGTQFPDWKENKIGKLGTFTKGAPLSKADISDCGEPLILYGELYTTYNEVAYDIQRRTQATVDEKYYSHVGDVIIPTSGESAEEISTATCVMAQNVILAGDLNIYRSDIVDGRITSYILNHQAKWKIAKLAQGKSVVHIQATQISDVAIKYPPSTVEQQKIASFFTELDILIQSAEKELEGYRELKQGMLQKMFPKKGEKVPEIRFPEFTGDWEQRKVGELLEERNEQAPMSDDYPLMAFIANQGVAPKGERYDRSALVNDEAGKKYKRTEFGDFIYSSNNLETGSIGLNKYGNACISPVYSIFKPAGKTDLDFLGRRFLRKDFINEMIKWRQGAVYGQWKIHETDFMKIVVRIPSVDEQKKIGQYFNSLDNLIALQQKELDGYKELKKGLLQQMFC